MALTAEATVPPASGTVRNSRYSLKERWDSAM